MSVFPNLKEQDYHALPALGSSTIKQMAVSPAYYQEQLKKEFTGTALDVGSMFHQLVLEPERELEFIAAPDVDRRTKEGKAIYAEFQDNCQGKTVLPKKDFDNTVAMAEAFKTTDAYLRMFKGDFETEVSIVGEDKKCRFDLLKMKSGKKGVAYDLKTTDEIPRTDSAWQRFFIKWGYHIQSAWYQHVARAEAGIEILAFHFAVVSKRFPFEHAVVTLDQEFVEIGMQRALSAYDLFKKCEKENLWPGVFEMSNVGSKVIEAPRWI